MTDALFTSLLAAGFGVAFLHAALPTHWLPFVMVGRAQAWSPRRILSVAALAGSAHVALTMVLGLIVVAAGVALHENFGGVLRYVAAGALFALAAFYLLRPAAAGPASPSARRTDMAAVAGLVTLLALSPCEAFLPVYLSGAKYGWSGFALLTITLTAATALAMLLFTSLAMVGAQRLRLERWARYEKLVLGLMLAGLGVLVLVLG